MNINQKELAIKANVTEGSLSRYENDIREPKAAALIQIADALDVSTDYLLGLTDKMEVQYNSLANKTDIEFDELMISIEKEFLSRRVLYNGQPVTQEAIDNMLHAMKIGMLLALDEQKNKRNKNR